MATSEPTMLAWTHMGPGLPSTVLSLSADIPKSKLTKPTQVLVRVSHAALNPGGSIMLQLCPAFVRTKPCIPELDFAGRIEAIGESVPASKGFSVGTEVFGSVTVAEHIKGAGTLAEFVAVDATTVLRLPGGMKAEEAAGLGVAGCTALDLVDKAALSKEGMRVLVNGAGGGIGMMAVQMVKRTRPALIVAICSGEKRELLMDLGADEVVVRSDRDQMDALFSASPEKSKFDVVVDAYGSQEIYQNAAKVLTKDGYHATVGVAFKSYNYMGMLGSLGSMAKNLLWPRLLGGTPTPYLQVASEVSEEKMVRLKKLSEEGALKVPVDSCWDMQDTLKAYEKLLSRATSGKVIVKI